ncbi:MULTISPECIES: hypothetical protein [unclassified Ruegeria]|uniref:hypothetical protein n=1 Tax=unclassified Ruegeria TaxID=2625375 RepID=UPI001492705D|nr:MULTISPECIES: hypothetical protein [unclassified Ruegeria]NOD88209.1 hypothetical protein [Ruegeria sp. HKCCD4318]NOE13118.1 hypothetical protein [Ruegeria sp. HKCCD4318-2]NOG11340.1 hypothetical protein [Ruegeria sp. HKCCD4315]
MADLHQSITLRKGRAIAPFEVDEAQSGVLKLGGALKKEMGAELRARLVPRKGQTRIATRIGKNAPPGVHKATLVTENGEYPVTVDVPERKKLRLSPASISLTGRPGERINAQFTISNRGNVALPVPTGGVGGLFASDGLAGAFSAAYASDAEAPLEVFGEFILGLRRSYLGLMRLKLTSKDKGDLAPGQSRDLTAEFTVPEPLNPATQLGAGRRFHTTIVMSHLRLVARLALTAPK